MDAPAEKLGHLLHITEQIYFMEVKNYGFTRYKQKAHSVRGRMNA